VIQSQPFAEKIAARITGGLRIAFLAANPPSSSGPPNLADLLEKNISAARAGKARIVLVGYRHPDASVAAQVANICAEELLALPSPDGRAFQTLKIVEPANPPPSHCHC